MRLLDTMPYHFAQITIERAASIVSTKDASQHGMRNPSQSYASADDYALAARFKDTTTDSWILVIAGIGRNGTDAAALFVTSPHYMEMLREKLGDPFGDRSLEVVLKVNVIDGKTGAPPSSPFTPGSCDDIKVFAIILWRASYSGLSESRCDSSAQRSCLQQAFMLNTRAVSFDAVME
ncbi:MAG: hypothetical protein WB439_02420 [Acidobacteriaceae bacterium]